MSSTNAKRSIIGVLPVFAEALVLAIDACCTRSSYADDTTATHHHVLISMPCVYRTAHQQGTEFFFNQDSGRIERHVESWEIEPIDALKQLIRPGRKKPTG